jgi:hypothetical protein
MFVAKYVDQGASVANGWATSGGGTDLDTGNSIAVSGANVYVTGSFASGTNASFAGQALPGAGLDDVFVAKYVDQGSSVANGWATSGGGSSADVGSGIAVSGTNVYVTGYYYGSNTSLAGQVLPWQGGTDMFVAKYVDQGASVANGWATSNGGTASDFGNSIAVSGANVYVTGFFTSNTNASFAGQTLPGAGSFDVFVAKYVD